MRLAIKNLWFDSKDFGFMRFEGSPFQKEKPDVSMESSCKQCDLQQMLESNSVIPGMGAMERDSGFKKNKNAFDPVLQTFGEVLQWVRRPVLGKQIASEPQAEE